MGKLFCSPIFSSSPGSSVPNIHKKSAAPVHGAPSGERFLTTDRMSQLCGSVAGLSWMRLLWCYSRFIKMKAGI